MQFKHKFIDVDHHIETGQQPVYLMDYDHAKEYYTVTSSLLAETIEWSATAQGQKVRIPVFAYRTRDSNVSLWGLGLQCGLRALMHPDHDPGVPAIIGNSKEGDEVILVFGDKCHAVPAGENEDTDEDGYRVYVGLTVARRKE